jgi:hypothetical protein
LLALVATGMFDMYDEIRRGKKKKKKKQNQSFRSSNMVKSMLSEEAGDLLRE